MPEKIIPRESTGDNPPVERLPAGDYLVICCTQPHPAGGAPVDHLFVEAHTGAQGLKIFFRVLSPKRLRLSNGLTVIVDGFIHTHTFWLTKRTVKYVKRDVSTILGYVPPTYDALTCATWAGHTCEIFVRDDRFLGRLHSKVVRIMPWRCGKMPSGMGTWRPGSVIIF